jgi:hypothetical protein
MNYDTPRNFVVKRGEALFFSQPDSPEALRRATRGGLLAGERPRRFRVMAEAHFYSRGAVRRLLWDGDELARTLEEHGNAHVGETDGALNCTALWECEHRLGLLVNRTSGALKFACLPVMTLRSAVRERQIARMLDEIAAAAGGVTVYAGDECQALDELLRGISGKLNE